MNNLIKKLKGNPLVRGSFVSLTLKVIGIGSGYLLFWVLSMKGGAEKVGEFTLGFNFIQLLGQISTVGLPVALLRFGVPYAENHNWFCLKELRKKALFLQLFVGILFAIISILFGSFFLQTFFKKELSLIYIVILSIAIPFYSSNLVSADLVRSIGEIRLSETFRSMIIPIFSIIIITLFWILKININELFLYVGCIIFTALLSFLTGKYLLNKRSMEFPEDSNMKKEVINLKELIKTTLPMTITSFAVFFMGKMTTFIIGYFYGPYEVGLYSIPFRLSTISSIVLQAVSIVVSPKIAAVYWSSNKSEVQKIVQLGVKLSFWGSIPILLLFFIFPEFFLRIFGREFVQAKNVFIILVIGQAINAWFGFVANYCNMTGKHLILSKFAVLSLLANVVLSIVLIKFFGLTGAALSNVLILFLWKLLATIHVYRKDKIITFYLFKFFKTRI